ncbi:MAG: hypothetical protein KDB79_00695 [Acidobacteria bacterium]|nr:hypothetical protein [Acidobacteriota bacterium]
MNTILRGILAVIAGVLVGGFVNMGILSLGNQVIALPAGADMTSVESMKQTMHLFGPRHYVTPFLAHALGVFVGALLASLIAASHNFKFAIAIAGFFLLGGITAAFLLPAPAWFIAVDLILAYIPMGWLGWKLSRKG